MDYKGIRESFLEFFKKRGHTVVPSSSLVPEDDPTLLFTSAGMVQFKPYWAGTLPIPFKRACSIQKCLRASDLEQVGKTIKHHTFFEMLGNFSFGDYFKKDAILWAWEYLTEVVRLPKDRLYVSVFRDDEEAYNIWKGIVEPERIYRLGEEDNFWGPAGATGACGPCSEIYFDMGEKFGCGRPGCAPGCECDRYIEVWNLVFPQYDQKDDGRREELKNRGIDTGMGLERLAMVSQDKDSTYETDIFSPIVQETSSFLKSDGLETKVVADHIRAIVFALSDGVLPSKEGRGYVIRKILRRALLFAKRRGIEEPFLYKLSSSVVKIMHPYYPEIKERESQNALIIKSEEERFLKTLDQGISLLEEFFERYKTRKVLPGEEVFKLYDTYGFPLDLTKELAEERGFKIEIQGFEREMELQRERSRKRGESFDIRRVEIGERQRFLGYEETEIETEITGFQSVGEGIFEVTLKDTPFYAEAGGQVGDTGVIKGEDFKLSVLDTYYKQGVRICKVKIEQGEIRKGRVKALVDIERRREIERAHTATHLLHSSLRRVLGDYVRQEGSLVEPGRLRFDFTSPEPLTREELEKIERLVYQKILEDIKVEKFETSFKEAKRLGALAFFGEKYGERVRVVKIGNFSMELCGGTHLRRTGEIGLFRIISETGVASGIRRIEALVGEGALRKINEERRIIRGVQERIGGEEETIPQRLSEFLEEKRRMENKAERLSLRLADLLASSLIENSKESGGIRVIIEKFPQSSGLDMEDLRRIKDRIEERLGRGFLGLLFSIEGEEAKFLLFTSPDLLARFPASRLASEIGRVLEGGGGGRPDMAQGGGKRGKIDKAIEKFLAYPFL